MILGVDIGTSVTKAALIDRDGTAVRSAERPSRLVRDGPRVEQDLEDVIGSVVAVVREVTGSDPESLDALAITGQGDGLWLRDEDGGATRAPISWMDARAAGLVEAWREGGPNSITDRVFRLTGSGLFPGSHAALIAYLAEHEPESLERAAVAGYCCDAVLQRLTGVITVDASDASLPFLDVKRREYVQDALALCGIASWAHLLTAPSAPGTVHTLSADGARLLGLPSGTPVTSGPYDLQACGYGSGSRREGDGTLVIGTTLSCQVLTADASVPADAEPAGMWLCTPDPAMFLRVMPSMIGTASIDWVLGLFGHEPAGLTDLLATSPVGAAGVRALSFLSSAGERAPFVDPLARAQLVGLELATGPADLVRSMCESIAYAARHCFDHLGLSGTLSACGGGVRSRTLVEIFAGAMGTPIDIPNEPMVGARGAAMIAWDSLGEPVDKDRWAAQSVRVKPVDADVAGYAAGYRGYLADLDEARTRWHRR